MKSLANDVLPFFFGIKWTTVFHCKWDNKASSCVIATDESFGSANGLTINTDRTKLFVNDLVQKQITVYSIHQNNQKLTRDEIISLPMVVDNIEYDDATQEILMGTVPDLWAAVQIHSNKSFPVPGGMAVLEGIGKDWRVKDVVEHDGTKLSQISAAARFGTKIILGSPWSEGVLVCNIN